MPYPSYEVPNDIKDYGKILLDFDRATKNLAGQLKRAGYSDDEMQLLIGQSPYNSLDADSGMTVYGPKEYQEAVRKPHSGLFGIFFQLHLPEMKLAKHLPGILGKEFGYRFQIIRDGKSYSVPLNELKLDFGLKSYGKGKNLPVLKVAEDFTCTAEDGSTLEIPKGEIIMKGGARQSSPEIQGVIVDHDGNPLDDLLCAKILWGSQGARGMKALQVWRRNILQTYGTDDDVAAQGALISALNGLKKQHKTDLIPIFNRYVEEALSGLQNNPQYMAILGLASQIDRPMADGEPLMARGKVPHETTHLFSQFVSQLGLKTPTMIDLQDSTLPYHKSAAPIIETLDKSEESQKRDNVILSPVEEGPFPQIVPVGSIHRGSLLSETSRHALAIASLSK